MTSLILRLQIVRWIRACPFGSGYSLQVLARIMRYTSIKLLCSLRAFRFYPSRKPTFFCNTKLNPVVRNPMQILKEYILK